MRNLKKILLLSILTISMCMLTGCEEVQLFEKETDPNVLIGVKDKELVNDIYYVKDNTRFYPVYLPKRGNCNMQSTSLLESRVFATLEDDKKIPTHYSDEFIAYASDGISFKSVNLERFLDLGYSIGCYNGTLEVDGTMYLNKQEGLVSDSSLSQAIGETQAVDIRIASIDGKALAPDHVYEKAGIITGLEKDKEYLVGFYVGTKYYEKTIKADTKMYAAFELFTYGDEYISDTRNGYMSFQTPQDLKSGYYNINGCGLFRYYNFEKGEAKEDGTDMNESYYDSEKSRLAAYSRQYKVSVPKRAKDLKITVSYTLSQADTSSENIEGILYSPDNERIDMTLNEEERTLSVSLSEAMAGDWTINIVPKTLNITDVKTESDEAEQEATCEETVFSLPEARENVEFIAKYNLYNPSKESECTIYGTITSEDGQIYEMTTRKETDEDNNILYYIAYEIPYVEAGEYTVRIYHLPEESTVEAPIVQDKTETDTDIIVIEG